MTMAVFSSVLRSRISSRICACTVTSSAVVGLVGDEQIGTAGCRHRDHHALAHPAGELMRVLLHAAARFGDAHQIEHFQRPLVGFAIGQAGMDAQRLDDLRADPSCAA